MKTLVLNLDERLARSLAAMAERSHKPLPEWAAEQLTRLASEQGGSYTEEWRGTFGSIPDPTFQAPARALPRQLEALDSE